MSRDLHFYFESCFISTEWLKVQTSNLMRRLMTWSPIKKFAKLGQMGTRHESRDLLSHIAPPLYVRNG